MFKNSKMLKGFVLALALVLVLGGGVLLKLNANAEANTVVLYVSDNGNNTTGKDAATAFTSFHDATAAANEMKLAPGTELKLIVVDQLYATDRYLDKNTVKDTAGNKVHLTITSEKTGSADEYATILHHAFNSSGSTSYEKMYLSNDITFKNIIISSELQPYYEENKPITGAVDYTKLYRTRDIHVGNNTVEFDACVLTSTAPEGAASGARSWKFLCDAYADSKVEGGSHLRLLNGNYANCTVYTQDRVTPLWDLSCTVENASVGTLYVLADTDTGTSANAKSVTIKLKNATVSSFNPQGRGNVGVTNGITAIFEGNTVVKNWVACMSSSDTTGTYFGDWRYYFRDNCSISATSTDSDGKAVIYLIPVVMTGDLYVTVEGGTFNNRFCTGTDANKSATGVASVLKGSIYNEFKGGTFKAGLTCGHGIAGDQITGTITNNFYDGFSLSGDTSYLGSRGGKCGTTVNNIYGGTFGKMETYFGGGNGLNNTDKNVIEGDLINNIYGGTWASTAWVGPHSQTITGGLYNTFMGGTFNGTFVAGGIGIVTPEVHNVFKNGPDGTYTTLAGTSALGSRGKNSSGPNVQNIDRLYNTFQGDVLVKGALYCAGGSQTGGKQISELVQNDFKGGTFSSTVYGGPRYDKDDLSSAELVNNFYDGATFGSTVYCGGAKGTVKNITNNFYGGLFKSYVYGATSCSSNSILSVNDITNNFYGGTFNSQVVGVGAVKSEGNLTNNFYGGVFKYYVYGISNSRTDVYNWAKDADGNYIYVDKNGKQVFLNGPEVSTKEVSKKNTLVYYVGDKTHYVHIVGSFGSKLDGTGYLTYDDGETPVFVDKDGNPAKYAGFKLIENLNHMNAVNNIYGGEFQAWFCGGSANSEKHDITNNIYGGHFIASHKEALHSEAGRTCFYGGDYAATIAKRYPSVQVKNSAGNYITDYVPTYYGLEDGSTTPIFGRTVEKVGTLTNNIYGGIFEKRVYLGGRIATIGKVNSMIAGGVFNGDRLQPGQFQHSASNKSSEITLDIKPDESDEYLFLGCHYTAYGVEGSKVYWSCGLESLDLNRTNDTITVYGAKKPIYIAGNSFLNFDKVLGEVTFIQTEDWQDGQTYVTVPKTQSLDMIKFINMESGLSGSAAVETTSVQIENGKYDTKIALVGSDGSGSLVSLTMPELTAMNFVLDNNLYVNFYVNKDALESYLATAGKFTYRVACGDDVLAAGSIADLAEAEVVGSYVKIKTDVAIAAFDYGEKLVLNFAGKQTETTLYTLLQEGMANSTDAPALVDLLKAIYNYGVEAETLRKGEASVSDYYNDITYTGTYTGKASGTSQNAGYTFVGTSLSIGKEVSLNFYLQAADRDALTFKAASANGALSADRIVVTPFDHNSKYNVVVSLRLDVASMDEVFTLTAMDAAGAELATCTNSVAYSCANYIAAENEFAPVSKALLAYIEKAQAI